MRKVSLPYQKDGEWWYISPLSGSLFRSKERPCGSSQRRSMLKVREAIEFCDNPYYCRWLPNDDSHEHKSPSSMVLKCLGEYFKFLGNRNFFLSVSCAGFNIGLFESTREAFSAISALPGLGGADDSCLQRSLLAAMVSKSFVTKGVVLIGAELSTGEMHAWIIEDGEQPDSQDRSWINYRPLLALCI